MPRERYTFEGLDLFEKRLRRKAKEIGYLVAWDRTDRRTEDTLARFDLTVEDALPYLEDDDELVDHDDDDDTFGIEEDDEAPSDEEPDDADPAARAERLLGRAPGPADFAVAASHWLRDLAVRNMGGESLRRFRVRAYAPKGVRVVETASFACRDDDAELETQLAPVEDAAVTELRIPPPTFETVEAAASAKGMRALGDYYAQWGQIVLGAVGQLQGINNVTLTRMHRQLEQSRDHVDQLLAAILTHRAAEAELAEQRRSSDRTEDSRTLLAQQALQQLGDAARAFLAGRGISPEMADAIGAMGQSPDLVGALADPDVRALMADPNNLKQLATMLRQAGAAARAAREATQAA